MPNDEAERLLNEIGQLLMDHLSGSSEPVLLHAEFDTNMVGPSIFIDRADHIEYQSSNGRFTYPLLDQWEQEKPRRRWAEMEYVLRDGKFEVSFTYRHQIDPKEDPFVRRDRVVQRHFGDKPIVYPPWDDDDAGERFDL